MSEGDSGSNTKNLKNGPDRRSNIVRLIIIALLLILVIALVWLLHHKNQDPIPKSIEKSVNFAIYYPSDLPAGYILNRNSFQVQNGILFFSFSSAGKKISVSEQSTPQNPPDLNALQKLDPSFNKLNTPAGEGVAGVDPASQDPVAIIETNTTLINLSGTKGTPSDVIGKLAQSLASLPQ